MGGTAPVAFETVEKRQDRRTHGSINTTLRPSSHRELGDSAPFSDQLHAGADKDTFAFWGSYPDKELMTQHEHLQRPVVSPSAQERLLVILLTSRSVDLHI